MVSIFCFILGPVASLCNERFSTRVTMFIGGILAALGLLLTVFATEFYMVLLSFGVLEGRPKFFELFTLKKIPFNFHISGLELQPIRNSFLFRFGLWTCLQCCHSCDR